MGIVIAIAVLLGVALLIPTVRIWIHTAALWTQGAFLWLWSQLPGVGGRVTRTARAIRNAVLVIWGIALVAFVLVGASTGSTREGWVIGICIPLILFLMYKSSFVRWVVMAPVVLFIVWNILAFTLGLFSTTLKGELQVWGGNKFGEGINILRKSSAKSESQAGTFVWISLGEELTIPVGKESIILKSGDEVMVYGLNSQPTRDKSEGMTEVVLKDEKTGYFTGPVSVSIPSRRLTWIKPVTRLCIEKNAAGECVRLYDLTKQRG